MEQFDWGPCRADKSKPCLNDVIERHDGVTVEILRCRRCGKTSFQWMRPEIAALQDAIAGDADCRDQSADWSRNDTSSVTAGAVPPPPQGEGSGRVGKKEPNPPPEPRDYWEAAEVFLRDLQPLEVQTVVMVALVNDPDVHDLISVYGAGPFELAAVAGILQMLAAHKYCGMNGEDPDDNEDEANEDDEEDDGEDEEDEPDEV